MILGGTARGTAARIETEMVGCFGEWLANLRVTTSVIEAPLVLLLVLLLLVSHSVVSLVTVVYIVVENASWDSGS